MSNYVLVLPSGIDLDITLSEDGKIANVKIIGSRSYWQVLVSEHGVDVTIVGTFIKDLHAFLTATHGQKFHAFLLARGGRSFRAFLSSRKPRGFPAFLLAKGGRRFSAFLMSKGGRRIQAFLKGIGGKRFPAFLKSKGGRFLPSYLKTPIGTNFCHRNIKAMGYDCYQMEDGEARDFVPKAGEQTIAIDTFEPYNAYHVFTTGHEQYLYYIKEINDYTYLVEWNTDTDEKKTLPILDGSSFNNYDGYYCFVSWVKDHHVLVSYPWADEVTKVYLADFEHMTTTLELNATSFSEITGLYVTEIDGDTWAFVFATWDSSGYGVYYKNFTQFGYWNHSSYHPAGYDDAWIYEDWTAIPGKYMCTVMYYNDTDTYCEAQICYFDLDNKTWHISNKISSPASEGEFVYWEEPYYDTSIYGNTMSPDVDSGCLLFANTGYEIGSWYLEENPQHWEYYWYFFVYALLNPETGVFSIVMSQMYDYLDVSSPEYLLASTTSTPTNGYFYYGYDRTMYSISWIALQTNCNLFGYQHGANNILDADGTMFDVDAGSINAYEPGGGITKTWDIPASAFTQLGSISNGCVVGVWIGSDCQLCLLV